MEFGLFEKIVQQCKGKRFLDKMALMGLGEPFLHPELIEMSRYAKAHKIYHVFTSTNGTLLNEKMSEAIVAQPGFDVIAVSLDGATKATYERIRKGADFDSVVKNIKTLIEIRKRLKKKRPGLVLQFLVMRENHQEKEAFIAFWEKYLSVFDIILIRDVDTFGGQVPDHRLASQVPRLKRRRCLQLWRDMIISWNGEVSVCCKDVNYLLKVGNVHEASLRDIWNSAQWNRLRLLHRQGRWDDIHLCSQCSEWG
jgi:radical SAM protein with 4Fe4S-binding SPASM domain